MPQIFSLNIFSILTNVPRKPGAYQLLFKSNSDFYISYVGRSDDDLAERLKDHLPSVETNLCIRSKNTSHFAFKTCSTAYEAYKEECKQFHKIEGRTCNTQHPQKSSSWWSCPICGA